MSDKLGADPEALEQLAQHFSRSSEALSTFAVEISRLVATVWWHGDDRDVFERMWRGRLFDDVQMVSTQLRETSQLLRRQAADQRQTSSDTVTGAGVLTEVCAEPGALEKEWALTTGIAMISAMLGASPEQQVTWWNSLTPDQREALIQHAPDRLLSLRGLPPDVLARAEQVIVQREQDELTLVEEKLALEFELDLRYLHVGGEVSGTMRQLGDGSYEVELAVEGELGAQLQAKARGGDAGVGGGGLGGVTVTYRFASEAEARAFIEGLQREIVPNKGELFRYLGNAPAITADAAADVYYHLFQTNHPESVEVHGGTYREVHVGAGPISAELRDEAVVTHDLVKGTTSLHVEGSASGDLGIASGNATAKAELTLDAQGNPTTLSVRLDVSATSGEIGDMLAKMNGSPVGGGATFGTAASFEIELDLSNPANAQLAREYVERLASGSMSRADFDRLIDASTVRSQVSTVVETTSQVDAGVAKVEATQTVTTTQAAYVKPPHGSGHQLDTTLAGSGGGGW